MNLCSVFFHIFETYSKGPAYQIINHGYLAVDFFFLLSGFVIGYAYDDRWNKMTVWGFFKRRLVRLHPMVIMGCLMIPCGPRMDIRGWVETNSFNGPNWSLTYEYFANILYALVLRKLPKLALAYACLKLYDIPIRKWLTDKWLKR